MSGMRAPITVAPPLACGAAGQREDGSVVGGIGLHVEHAEARHGAQRLSHPVDDVGATPFADIGDTFDQRHRLSAYAKCYNQWHLPMADPQTSGPRRSEA